MTFGVFVGSFGFFILVILAVTFFWILLAVLYWVMLAVLLAGGVALAFVAIRGAIHDRRYGRAA